MSYTKQVTVFVLVVVSLVLMALLIIRCAQETVPRSPEPTVEETLIVEDTQPDVTVLPDTSGPR